LFTKICYLIDCLLYERKNAKCLYSNCLCYRERVASTGYAVVQEVICFDCFFCLIVEKLVTTIQVTLYFHDLVEL